MQCEAVTAQSRSPSEMTVTPTAERTQKSTLDRKETLLTLWTENTSLCLTRKSE